MNNLYSGRTDAKTWIKEVAVYSSATVIIWLVLASFLEGSKTAYWLAILLLLIAAGVIISASSVRRFHDKGESGWYAFYLLIPLINLVVIKDLFAPGQPTSNKYGEPILKQAHKLSRGKQSAGKQVGNVLAAFAFFMVLFSIAVVALSLLFNSTVRGLPWYVMAIIFYATLRFWRWLH